jgi:polysaccharide chain length determinant protein (PEP-CTERM system associated)
MDQLLSQIIAIAHGLWERRFSGLVVAWVVAVIGLVILFRLPDRYEASARVFVDTESLLKPLMSGLAVQPDVGQRVSILSRTLISRPNIEKLVRMTDLDHTVSSASAKDRLIEELLSTVKLEPAGLTNLYLIKYRDSSPDRAKRIVQSLLSIFMESSLGEKRKDSSQAKEFIEEQIALYEKKLQEAESRLKDFRLKHLGQLSGGKDYFGRMETVTTDMNNARMELREAEQSRDALKRELAEQKSLSLAANERKGSAAPPEIAVPELDGRIQTLKTELDELLRKYTELHPDVVQTKRIIDQLEEQRRHEVEARLKAMQKAAAESGDTSVLNPIVQQLKIGLTEAEANVAGLRARVSEYESRYQQLKAAAEQVPEIDNELAQLNRDYEVIKGQYASLVSRREAASLTGELEETGTMANFRVIDPPRVSTQPVAPNRLLLALVAFLAALAAGVGASFVMSQLFPTFHDIRVLWEVTKRPVLGTVMALQRPEFARRARRRIYLFAGGLGSLVACYGMVVLLFLVVRPV